MTTNPCNKFATKMDLSLFLSTIEPNNNITLYEINFLWSVYCSLLYGQDSGRHVMAISHINWFSHIVPLFKYIAFFGLVHFRREIVFGCKSYSDGQSFLDEVDRIMMKSNVMQYLSSYGHTYDGLDIEFTVPVKGVVRASITADNCTAVKWTLRPCDMLLLYEFDEMSPLHLDMLYKSLVFIGESPIAVGISMRSLLSSNGRLEQSQQLANQGCKKFSYWLL